ncbi:hypothetical protein JJL53_11080 [Aeromonas media]|uniref:hypothetical protein n=1 Tax=Aeromonas media TaxID=651 RepID=UPI001914192D|nr:hypothetical protein [Aeromonas media]QQQ15808.1 hypothetical protein JJL53_11080 [Aeromonas media]
MIVSLFPVNAIWVNSYTAEALSAVEKRLNFRPRKCLGFKQPQVVFDELLKAA